MPATDEQNSRFPFLDHIDDDEAAAQAALNYLIQLTEHPGWRILMAQFEQDETAALEDLRDVSPQDAVKIAELQVKARQKNYMLVTLEQLIYSMQEDNGEVMPPED